MKNFIQWLEMSEGSGITFVDIDEVIFHTFAKILVKDKKTGEIIKELTNQEYNSYELKPNEEYNYGQFRDSQFFKDTSIPIENVVNRIKNMINRIKQYKSDSKIYFLTARANFNDKETFLDAFRDIGIDIDFMNVHIYRAGNRQERLGETVPVSKKNIILNIIQQRLDGGSLITRIRMLDDHLGNIKEFLNLYKDKRFQEIAEQIANIRSEDWKKRKEEDPNLQPIELFGLLVKKDGSFERVSDNV